MVLAAFEGMHDDGNGGCDDTPNTPTLVQPNTTVPVGNDAISAKTSARIHNERVQVLNKFLIQLRDNHQSLIGDYSPITRCAHAHPKKL